MKYFLGLTLVSFLASASVIADVQVGTYSGKQPDGSPCKMRITRVYHENNVHHPLTERVVAIFDQDTFVLSHPPVIEPANLTAHFNHDILQGVLPTPTGARAMGIEMKHGGGYDGPVAFFVIDHQWRNNLRRGVACGGLVHSP